MSTRSRIAIKNKNGSYRSIYVHWDGDRHLEILKKYYSTEEKVNELLGLGDLSILGVCIGEKIPFDTYPVPNNQCVAYGRDRGYDVNVSISKKYSKFKLLSRDCDCEYMYIFYPVTKKWIKRSVE